MGCDIRDRAWYQGKWEHYSIPRINRWYDLFGIMAGHGIQSRTCDVRNSCLDGNLAVTFVLVRRRCKNGNNASDEKYAWNQFDLESVRWNVCSEMA